MRLKDLRKNKKQSQQEISNLLNISQRTYCGYELGTSEPNLETLCILADYYNVTLDYLVGREFKNEIGFLSEQQMSALKLIKQLNEKNLAYAIAYLSGMIVNQ